MPKKVLLIEYEPRYVERVRNLLTPHGHTVTEAHDGEAGLQAFGASKFDLILLSGMLPRLPSAEVIREIRKKGGATAPPIILMMSGYKGSNRKADAQKVGAFDILLRPFSDEDFMVSVQEAVDATDMGAKTMRIDTAQVAAAMSPLTSSDIFSDVLDDLTGDAPAAKAAAPAPPPLAAEPSARRRLRRWRPPDRSAAPARGPGREGAGPRERHGQAPARHAVGPDGPAAHRRGASGRAVRQDAAPADARGTQRAAAPEAFLGHRRRQDPLGHAVGRPRRARSPGRLRARAVLHAAAGDRRRPRRAGAKSRPPRSPRRGPDRFGQYEILERIASGGMAELYKAKRTGVEGFQKIVAIKKILPHLADDEEFVTMFADEAKLAAQLNHPNIIHIYDLGKIQAGGYFIAMEYVDGRDLRAIQQAGRELGVPLPVPLAVYIASKVASALDYAHRRRDAEGHELNIVHRDVSPQNILISYEGDIKLCDFGIAKAASKASKTQSGALKGKIQYMSPEQAWGKPIDRRSDLFSLGVVLHELLTGERLFHGDTDINILEKVRVAEIAPPSRANPEVPQNLDAVVLKALAREPDDRYANASDLLRDLDSVLYSYTPGARQRGRRDLPPPAAGRGGRGRRREGPRSRAGGARGRARGAQAQVEGRARLAQDRSLAAAFRARGGRASEAAASAPAAGGAASARASLRGLRPRSSARSRGRREAEKSSRTPLVVGVIAAALALAGFLRLEIHEAAGRGSRVRDRESDGRGDGGREPDARVRGTRADGRGGGHRSEGRRGRGAASARGPAQGAREDGRGRQEGRGCRRGRRGGSVGAPEPTAAPTIPPTPVPPPPTAVPTEPPPPTSRRPSPWSRKKSPRSAAATSSARARASSSRRSSRRRGSYILRWRASSAWRGGSWSSCSWTRTARPSRRASSRDSRRRPSTMPS